jgi:hypothetical protein
MKKREPIMFLRSSSGPRPRRPYGKMAAETVAVALVLAVAVYAVVQFKDAGLVAAVLTFLGVLLTAGAKQLLEHRSDQRLRLDAAMRAGALLTPTKDAPVSSAAAASGLLALTELGRSDLAVALLVDLWPGDAADEVSVSKETAILVINAALKSGATQPSAPLVAAELLCRHADTLDPCQSLHWPSVLDGGWIPERPRTGGEHPKKDQLQERRGLTGPAPTGMTSKSEAGSEVHGQGRGADCSARCRAVRAG